MSYLYSFIGRYECGITFQYSITRGITYRILTQQLMYQDQSLLWRQGILMQRTINAGCFLFGICTFDHFSKIKLCWVIFKCCNFCDYLFHVQELCYSYLNPKYHLKNMKMTPNCKWHTACMVRIIIFVLLSKLLAFSIMHINFLLQFNNDN